MNQHNAKHKKHGHWEEYYVNGDLRYKGLYINNKESGFWIYYEPLIFPVIYKQTKTFYIQ